MKLVTSPHPDDLRTAYELGITAQILPEFDLCMETPQRHKHHCYDVGEHILHSMLGVKPDKVLRLGMLFHDIGKPQTLTIDPDGTTHNKKHPFEGEKITRKVMRRLKFDIGQTRLPCLGTDSGIKPPLNSFIYIFKIEIKRLLFKTSVKDL